MESFTASGIHTKQAHVKIPEGHYEEEHGRKGFFGRVSQLYHQHPLTSWRHIDGELKPRALPPVFTSGNLPKSTSQLLLSNQDVQISVCLLMESSPHFYRNADFDELLFFHEGEGRIETVYGPIDFVKGDYVVIPRGTTFKIFLTSPKNAAKILRIEANSEFEQPERGLLGPNALYDQSAITIPKAGLGSEQGLKEYKVEIKRLGKSTMVTYPFNPLDAIGWKGSLYPWKISIYDFCPINSHKYHIPPSGHTTFVCRNFVICSFVARPLEDSREGVLKVPFYHANIDYDEVLFYHQGNFFSRDNIGAGAITFHPQGIHHGPHPKAFQLADAKTHTDEYAVMIDTRYPLHPSEWFEKNENRDYWKSWGA